MYKKMRRGLKIVCIIACIILLFMFVCNLVLIIKSFANKDKVPSIFSVTPVYVLSGSMEPTIYKGDLVFVKKSSPKDIAAQDIIAFFDPESEEKIIVVHRVKEVLMDDDGEISFMTAGDYTGVADNLAVPDYNLVGIYAFRLRGIGYVAMFLQSTPGLVLSIIVPILMLIAFESIRIVQSKGEESEKSKELSVGAEKKNVVVVPTIVSRKPDDTEELGKNMKNNTKNV